MQPWHVVMYVACCKHTHSYAACAAAACTLYYSGVVQVGRVEKGRDRWWGGGELQWMCGTYYLGHLVLEVQCREFQLEH